MSLDLNFDEKTKYALNAIDTAKKNLVTVDSWLMAIREAISEESYENAIIGCGKSRLKLSQSMQLIDKISVIASNENRESVIAGYSPRETTLGSRQDISKCDNDVDLIKSVVRGKVGVRGIAESFTKP